MNKRTLLIFVGAGLVLLACRAIVPNKGGVATAAAPAQSGKASSHAVVYQTEHLTLQQLSQHVYLHISYLQTNSFGRVDCNGMVVARDGSAVVFDTPATEAGSAELIKYVTQQLKCTITAIIPTHFHEDCVGGLATFQAAGIPAHASHKTLALLALKNRQFSKPINSFADTLALPVGNKMVYARYFGEGHTKDNIVGYFPEDKALFGGCLIKAAGATKGNLEDANVGAWPATVRQLAQTYPQAAIVIPGHGKWGGPDLLNYTIQLFE